VALYRVIKVKFLKNIKMKSNLNLSSYNVEELNQQEMLTVEGGGKVGDAISAAAGAVAGAVKAAYKWVKENVDFNFSDPKDNPSRQNKNSIS
jgi:histidine ammonia-lyase